MQFNYQNARIEEENHSDFRRYGLLNKNLVDDEQELDNYLYKSLLDKVKIYEESNNSLENLSEALRNDVQVLSNNNVNLENELNNIKNKLVETENKLINAERTIKNLMNKSMN